MITMSTFANVKNASIGFRKISHDIVNIVLLEVAMEAERLTEFLLTENSKDLMLMDPNDPKFDRLKLTADRIKSICSDIRNVARLSSPLGKVLDEKIALNGLKINKITVPIGVIGVIYEARPNVTFDVF